MEFVNDTDMEDAAGTPAAADTVPSMGPLTPSTNNHLPKSTAVDGQGMWRSWTRVFAKPESACLDLLDNCFDAALKLGFRGRVEMSSQHVTSSGTSLSSTVTIQNNSKSSIKPLEAALTVYKSSKNMSAYTDDNNDKAKDSIGENGVGLKQGCATLSDCSIVLTRNRSKVDIGIIAKQLQTSAGIFLPSCTLEIQDPAKLRMVIARWLEMNHEITQVLATSFGPSVDVEEQVTKFAEYLYQNDWEKEDHIFLLVLCNLKASPIVSHELIESVRPAKTFLENIKEMLPEHYINLPAQGMFDFYIDQERVSFSYWQHRLVELTKFEVYIAPKQPFDELPEADWDKPSPDKYPLSIYCGFDAQRLEQNMLHKKGTSNCILYVYSCEAGRLITKEIDARHILGLNSSGVDFTQGLTVIVNDVAGKLPLTPTKDGIAWSEQTNGDIHRKNLVSWAGGVAQFYWSHYKNIIGKGKTSNNVKKIMKKAIASFAEVQRKNTIEVSQNLENADFTQFQGILWRRSATGFDNIWKIRRQYGSIKTVTGPDTLFQLSAERIQTIRDGKKPTAKRKATTDLNANPEKRASNDGDATKQSAPKLLALPLPELDVDPWDEVDQNDVEQVSYGVLSFFREKDTEQVFEIPVWEAFTTIKKEEYMKVVPNPMCFRDIENERMKHYKSIKELQDDLILVFQNCLRFNKPSSKYANLAKNMLDCLDEAIESTDIKQVTMRTLAYLRDLDERELFEVPVVEQCPHLKDVYLQKVQTPMDFRTIEETRIHTYKSKEDLRQDLELIFHNCITFNSSDSSDDYFFREVAHQMLKILDRDFEKLVHGKLGIGKRKRKAKLNYAEIEIKYFRTGQGTTRNHSKPKNKPDAASLKRKLQNAESQIHKLRQEVANGSAQIRFVEERRSKEVQELKWQLEDRDLRIRHLESRPQLAPNERQQQLERTILNRDGRIKFLEERKSELEKEVAPLKRQVAEHDQLVQQLEGLQAQQQIEGRQSQQDSDHRNEIRVQLMGGIPRTVLLPPGSLDIVVISRGNKLIVSKVSETGPMYGKIFQDDIIFSFCGEEVNSMQLPEFQARFAATTENQERTLCVVTPSNCFLDEGECSEVIYKEARGLPVEPVLPKLASIESQTQIQRELPAEASDGLRNGPENRSPQRQAVRELTAPDEFVFDSRPEPPNEPHSEDCENERDHNDENDVKDSVHVNDPQGANVDLKWLLLHRSNKISDGERVRVQKFIEGINPTPDQPIYKMKTHVQKAVDPETGEDIKEIFYLELNYHDFSKNETKKIRRY